MGRKFSVTRGSRTRHYNTRTGAIRGAKKHRGTFHLQVNKPSKKRRR